MVANFCRTTQELDISEIELTFRFCISTGDDNSGHGVLYGGHNDNDGVKGVGDVDNGDDGDVSLLG